MFFYSNLDYLLSDLQNNGLQTVQKEHCGITINEVVINNE